MNRTLRPPLMTFAWLIALVPVIALIMGLMAPGALAQDLVFPPPEEPQRLTDGRQVVDVATAWESEAVPAGQSRRLAVVLTIKPEWHINTATVAQPFIPTRIEVADLPAGVTGSTTVYPAAQKEIDLGFGEPVAVHSGRVIMVVPVAVGPTVAAGEYPIKLNATWQACQDSGVCLQPVTVSIEATLKVAAAGSAAVPINAEIFAAAPTVDIQLNKARSLRIPFFGLDFDIDPTNLLILLPLAALGGFLLNFTPCVLPLVPIKVLGLVQAGGTRSRTLLLGIATFSGVIVFWLGLGVAISTISGFTATNQLFQFPAFTLTVGLLIAVMAVGMLGAFAVRLPQWVYFVNPKQESVPGSVTFGVMIAVLSTPCTAPAMGAAAAWAATQSPVITLATFAAIGTGMALPYLLLATFPKLVDRMPRTGPASELIKQVMGLLMMAAAAYFLGTGLSGLLVSPPDPPSRLYWWAVAGLVILAGLWLARRTLAITRRPGKRVVFVMIALLMIVGGLYIGLDFTRHGPVRWTYYTPDRLAAARSEGKVVVLEFTAEWCLNCKLLEQAVLHTDAVADLLNSTDVAPIKIDLTGNNEAGNAKLLEVGRRTIPLLVIYGRDGSELLKSDAYTPSQVIEALQQARGERLE